MLCAPVVFMDRLMTSTSAQATWTCAQLQASCNSVALILLVCDMFFAAGPHPLIYIYICEHIFANILFVIFAQFCT